MADKGSATDGPTVFDDEAYDFSKIPDFDNDFIAQDDLDEFAKALSAPELLDVDQDFNTQSSLFITALNDFRPVRQRVRRCGTNKRKRKFRKGRTDETREGFVYTLIKWPLLLIVLTLIFVLGLAYMLTRLYVSSYEKFITIRGKRERLRKILQSTRTYGEWVKAAKDLDQYLGNEDWKENDQYAYYNSSTIRNVRDEMGRLRAALAKSTESGKQDIPRVDAGKRGTTVADGKDTQAIADELRTLVEAAAKDNFVGVENSRLYSETYYGTKTLVQGFIDEVEESLSALSKSDQLTPQDKTNMFKHLYTNYGRTALCLSGGGTFAYYHFGVAKALLDAGVLPDVITGTSGGALVAGLLCTRTDDELKRLLVPALAGRINACQEGFSTWFPRWYRTGARFDSLDWARRCAWFCHGSLTFREAYERTGRILNVTCIPSDPHSPAVLANYLTAPDCVVWSAVLASAAVPGILNAVCLMRKTRGGTLVPYSFGHKWKDGSLKTDIPLKALNTHFNVNFSIVSQVNPHINLFFFSSRGAVGRPVTHRRGRGWRGGFLGSAMEQYLKLDLTKWLKVLKHLELLPRPLGTDWSGLWLQRFSGTVTIWPKSILSDFYYILSDPPPSRLARMIHVGQHSTFPKLKFVANRMKIEKLIEDGSRFADNDRKYQIPTASSEEDLQSVLDEVRRHKNNGPILPPSTLPKQSGIAPPQSPGAESPSIGKRLSGWWQSKSTSPRESFDGRKSDGSEGKRGSIIAELERQSRVFFDDTELEDSEADGSALGSAVEDTELSDAEETHKSEYIT